jgi:hypothetical protein
MHGVGKSTGVVFVHACKLLPPSWQPAAQHEPHERQFEGRSDAPHHSEFVDETADSSDYAKDDKNENLSFPARHLHPPINHQAPNLTISNRERVRQNLHLRGPRPHAQNLAMARSARKWAALCDRA